jgi:hypothetical protein
MGQNENNQQFRARTTEDARSLHAAPHNSSHALPMIAGPGIVVAAILAVHGYNLYLHWQNYVEAPPTISHALLDPAIAAPFAIAMIISAIFLTWAVLRVALALGQLVLRTRQRPATSLALLLTGVSCQLVAIAGMVVLSQFTGNVNQHLHDIGSYMLFFGHSIGTSLLGILSYLQLRGIGRQDLRNDASARTVLSLRKQPRRALGVAILGTMFGIAYFGGKYLPDAYFFWQRTVMSILEVVVIFSFLGFLVAFWPFLEFWTTSRPQATRDVQIAED